MFSHPIHDLDVVPYVDLELLLSLLDVAIDRHELDLRCQLLVVQFQVLTELTEGLE